VNDDRHSGIAGLVSAVLALLGLWAAQHPTSRYVVVITQHQGELRQVLTYVLTFGGLVGTWVTHPNTRVRAWFAARWHDVKGFAKWGAVTR